MSKEIYRGKRSYMRVGKSIWIEGELDTVFDDLVILVPTENGIKQVILIDSKTLGRYTKRIDKNGKKIFGGDIVHFRTSGLSGYGEVKDENGRFVIVDKRKKPTRYYPFYDDAIYRVDGNIHDNPELLEETE